MKTILAIVVAALSFASIAVHGAPPAPKDLSPLLAPSFRNTTSRHGRRRRSQRRNRRPRRRRRPHARQGDKIAVGDRFHLGSDTKAMTAMLCGILVDEGKLKWSQTLGETFPELKKSMHPQYQAVTLEQLLTHAQRRTR
jgi:CubicO group peptidase (beta-lactamase class C family)